MSRGVVGRVSASLISDPDYIHKLLYQLVKDNPDAFDRRQFRRFPTSIETLETNSDILLALLAMKPAPDVAIHSIIGSLRPGPRGADHRRRRPLPQRHLDGVLSEKVVRSDHGVQKDGEAIQEVRAILRTHVGLPIETARAGREGTVPRPAQVPAEPTATAARPELLPSLPR